MSRIHSPPDRLQSIADVLGLPVEIFFDEPVAEDRSDEPSLDDLRRAFVAAAEAYNRGLQRKAQSVSLSGTANA